MQGTHLREAITQLDAQALLLEQEQIRLLEVLEAKDQTLHQKVVA